VIDHQVNRLQRTYLVGITAELFDRVREALGELHSYEIPECIEIVVEAGATAYLDWIAESVR